jgi:hypothetical protein
MAALIDIYRQHSDRGVLFICAQIKTNWSGQFDQTPLHPLNSEKFILAEWFQLTLFCLFCNISFFVSLRREPSKQQIMSIRIKHSKNRGRS